MKKLKVSLVIACLNPGKDLEKTFKSFLGQDYPEKELIIIDGKSKDGTKSFLEKNTKHISYWVSQPDKGISDAFNKGVKAATGDYLIFFGAGDYFFSPKALSVVMKGVKGKELLIGAKVNRVNSKGKVLYTAGGHFKKEELLYKMALPHQGLFTHKDFFKKYGFFDLNCRYAMDYELLLRAYKTLPQVIVRNHVLACWQEGGVGTDKTDEVIKEYHQIRLKNHVAPAFLLWLIYRLTQLRYKWMN